LGTKNKPVGRASVPAGRAARDGRPTLMTIFMTQASFQPDASFMRLALSEARSHLTALHGGPFGACLVRGGEVLAVSHNTVLKDNDPTCHAEINTIRQAARKLGTYDLTGCDLYSTTEPCPMCFAAIHWARLGRLIYGTGISAVQALGFNELSISNERLKTLGGSPVSIYPHFLEEDCRGLLEDWLRVPGRRVY
jgi:guanine deaminase